MSSEMKKANNMVLSIGIALGVLLFLILFRDLSLYNFLIVGLTLLIFLTLQGIWFSIPNKKSLHVNTQTYHPAHKISNEPSAHVFNNVYPNLSPLPHPHNVSHKPSTHVFTNSLSNLSDQSFSEHPEREIVPNRVTGEFKVLPKAPEVKSSEIKVEKPSKMDEIEKEIEEVLSKYRRSNLYQDYIGQVDSSHGLFEQDKKEEEIKEIKEFKKPEVKSKVKAKEVKKHKWVNVSEDKKGKVKFKEEEVEAEAESLSEVDAGDPDKEAEEYILKLNKKAQENPAEEVDEDDEDQREENEEGSFY